MAKTITDNPDGSPDLSIEGLFPQGQPSADSPLGLGALAQGVNTPQPGPYPAGTPLERLYQSAPIPAETTSATVSPPPALPYGTATATVTQVIYSVAADLAQKYGVDPLRLFQIALATVNQESGGNPQAVGDGGTSFGLFQLHQGGELGSLTAQQAYNPWVNATTAMTVIAQTLKANPGMTDGQVAAAAQRPADPTGYAASVDAMIKAAPNGVVTLGQNPTAGTGAGAAPGGPAAGQTPATTTIGALSLAQAQQQYPELAWMLTIPDAAADIQTWAAQNYTPDEIAARLQGKAWYQRLGAPFFTWIAAQATNPSQAAQTFQEELAAVKQTFQQLGLQPSPQQLQTFAYQALAQDWTNHPELEQQAIASTVHPNKDGTFSVRNFTITSAGQLASTFIGPTGQPVQVNWQDFQKTLPTNYIGSGLVSQIGATKAGGGFTTENITPGAPVYALINGQLEQGFDVKALAPGTALYTLPNYVTGPTGQAQVAAESHMAGSLTAAEQAFKAAAADYMVPVSDAAAAQLVQQALQSGTTDIATFAKTYFTAQAKSLYPSMAGAIDAGITPRAYTDPYRQVVAQLLGTSPDSINMSDPKYMRFVTNKDPKTGVPTAMSLYDAQQLVMSDPIYGYMKTQGAADRASALAQGIGEMFGKVAPTPAGFTDVSAPRV